MCTQILLFRCWRCGGGSYRVRVKCAWAKFKELSDLSPIMTACGASYHMKRKIYRACVQSVLTYGTETWTWSLKICIVWRRQSIWWWGGLCGASLKDRKQSGELYSLLGIWSVTEVVRLRWFGHLWHESVDDWALASRNVEVAGVKCRGEGRKTR